MTRSAITARKGAAILAAVSLGCAATAASAADTGSVAFAKSEAIIGGSSKLAEILSQQGGTATPVLAPASRGSIVPAKLDRAPVRAAARPDMPDVFGSVALRVGRTSLDKRWRDVEGSSVGGTAAEFARSLADRDEMDRLDVVNRYVNRRVAFTDDSRQFGRADLWLSASATLERGKGDCEDYAIAKMQMLRKAGIAKRDMYLVIVKDLVRRSDHAVLVVRSGERLVLLDNGTDEIRDAQDASDYRPVLTFAASGTWTHGYRRVAETVQMASTEIRPVRPAAGFDSTN